MDRRRFLRYLGAGVVAATATGAGYYLYSKPRGYPPIPTRTATIPQGWESVTTYLHNSPPVIWSIDVKPKYINPTSETTIRLSHSSSDWDNDPLLTTWLIDWKEVSHEPDYSTKLPEGVHAISLNVSDGKSQASKYATVTVDPDQIYPTKPLGLKYKGICYCAGKVTPELASYLTPSRDEMDEQLSTIHDELGCNAIIIMAGADYEDNLIECGRMAIGKGFHRVYILPRYFHHSIDETVDRIARFAPRVRALREASEVIHFMVGHELSLEISGIVPGDNWFERLDYCIKNPDWMDRVRATFPGMFKDIIAACEGKYGYKISYAAIMYAEIDAVPWSDPVFESVGIDADIMPALGVTDERIFSQLSELKRKFGKPVIVPDFACMTYTGADQYDGAVLWKSWESGPYDEDAQAKFIKSSCDVYNRAKIEGCFYYQYNEDFDKSAGLCNRMKRKKGFYMYKSYQRSS